MILGVTVDNAAANTTFINCLGVILNREDTGDMHFRCLSHILNLEVQDILKIFDSGFKEINDVEENLEDEDMAKRRMQLT